MSLAAFTSSLSCRKAFAGSPRRHQAAARGRLQVQAFKITFINEKKGTERVCEVAADDYLLDGADASRIDLNASCRGGVCGTCVSKLRSGRVDLGWLADLDEGSVLSQAQIQAGYILPCSAKPLSDCVVEVSDDWGVHVIEEWSHNARD